MTVTAEERESLERAKRIRDRLTEVGVFDRIEPRDQVRFRYFSAGHKGPRFGWTTERVDGKFVSFEWTDHGLVKERQHAKRKDAKARAMKLYEQHTGEAPA